MVELEGNISNDPVSILIDMDACLRYVNPRVVDLCHLTSSKFKNPLMVLLVTWSKRRVNANVYDCVNKYLPNDLSNHHEICTVKKSNINGHLKPILEFEGPLKMG